MRKSGYRTTRTGTGKWSKGGKLIGESPARIRFLRELLESLPGLPEYAGPNFSPEQYEARRCTCLETLRLPETGAYRIEVTDVWEMNRKIMLQDVNGRVEVKLPGKEGIAVLARKTGKN